MDKQTIKNEENIHLYTFWEGPEPSLYLQLCMETWYANIPNLQIEQINYDNLDSYVGKFVDISKLKKFSLAMQSDVISSIVLATRGGTFIDIDTIMLPNVDIDFLKTPRDRINVFGIPSKKVFHVAVMSALRGNSAMLHWMNESTKRVKESPSNYSWNYLAGDILEKMTISSEYSKYFNIIDRKSSGNILEAAWSEKYIEFYFNESKYRPAEELVAKAKYGILSLHNSWTPKAYSAISDRDKLLGEPVNLSGILSFSLGSDSNRK